MTAALAGCGAPGGTLSIVHGFDSGPQLVTDPHVRAAGFTGSARGGQALEALAQGRTDPIPFDGELSGINPLVVTAAAADERAAEIASGLIDSITLGGGQFCTKPGLAFVPDTPAVEFLLSELTRLVGDRGWSLAVNAAIREGFVAGRDERLTTSGIELLGAAACDGPDGFAMRPSVLVVSGSDLVAELMEECFGPLVVVVRYSDATQLRECLRAVPGSLTASIHTGAGDTADGMEDLVRLLRERAGRLIWNGFPTGVAVLWSMQHGGPVPATTNSLHTSVGPTAVRRFLRPVAWQNAPQAVLPAELRDGPPQRATAGERWAGASGDAFSLGLVVLFPSAGRGFGLRHVPVTRPKCHRT